MVGYAPLGEVVSAYTLASVARADKRFSVLVVSRTVLRIIIIVQPRTQYFKSLVLVFKLTALVLTSHHNARGKVGYADSRFGLVDLLPARAA